MEKLFTYIERYKFAILGTVLFHFIFFLSSNFVTIQRPYNSVEEIVDVELEMDEFEIDEELMKMLEMQEQMTPEEISALIKDQNDKREKSYENFSSQDIDNQVMDDAKALEAKYFEELASQRPEGGEASNAVNKQEQNIKPEAKTKQKFSDKSAVNNNGENAFAGRVMVSFSLTNRKAHSLEIPGYTCNGSGTVVMDIKVDKSGYVKDASYNSNMSSGATDCMIDKAKSYASIARFSFNSEGGLSQSGTITYKFIGQ